MADFSRHEDFLPYAGRTFCFSGQTVTLVLAEIKAMPRAAIPGAERIPFSLIFHGSAGDVLPEGLYAAAIEAGPKVDLYIMPVHTRAAGRQEYQAVFN
nr:hypothetical protein [uncultured Rhodopila sp.]